MSTSDFTSDRSLSVAGLLAGIVVAVLTGIDLHWEMAEGASFTHVLSESILVLVGLGAAAIAARRLAHSLGQARAARAEAAALAGRLEAAEREAARWRREARGLMEGLAVAIDGQFDRWGLSPAEKETGLLLLKGLSHKQIAAARGVTEATARQQSRAVYRKAGLDGRHDLAAFFLEDLMLPARGPGTVGASDG